MRAFVVRLLSSLAAASAATGAAGVEPTAFERFATDPGTVVIASREIGSLRSLDATAKVTVLVGADRADAARRMRGARFELSSNVGTETVYLDESQLERLGGELGLMDRFKDPTFSDDQPRARGMTVQGTESCWMPNPVLRILCPELQAAPSWSGIRLWTFGGDIFEFRDHGIEELRELIERAVDELDAL